MADLHFLLGPLPVQVIHPYLGAGIDELIIVPLPALSLQIHTASVFSSFD